MHETRTLVVGSAELTPDVPLGPTGRFRGRNFWWATCIGLAFAALCGLTFAVDSFVSEWIAGVAVHGTPLRRAMTLSAHFFRWPVYVLFVGLLLLHVRRWRLLAAFVGTLAGALVVLHTLKFLVGRMRPDGGCGAYCFCPLGSPQDGFDSFPSGHATVAVLLVALGLLYLPRLRVPLVALGVLACLSRIALERHYASDVVAGVGLALLTVYLARRWLGAAAFPGIRRFDLQVPRPRRIVLSPRRPAVCRAPAPGESDVEPAIAR